MHGIFRQPAQSAEVKNSLVRTITVHGVAGAVAIFGNIIKLQPAGSKRKGYYMAEKNAAECFNCGKEFYNDDDYEK